MKANRRARKPFAPLRPERTRLISQGALGRTALQRHVFGDGLHIPQDRRIENPGIVAGHFRIRMSEHFGDVFNGRAACKGQRGERVPGGVGGEVFFDSADVGQFFQVAVHLLVAAHGQQYAMRLTIGIVAVPG